MQRVIFVFAIFSLIGSLFFGCSKESNNPISVASTNDLSLKAPKEIPTNGAHYNLNIIGVPKEKTAAMDDNSGHRIFVKLEGNTKIMLAEGETFRVLDANGTDGDGATFQLPNPDPDNNGITEYSVYARALGKPGGKADLTTGATDPGPDGVFGTDDDEVVYSMVVLHVERTKGHQKFVNVSKQLLYIYVDLDGDGVSERYNLFNDALQDYFWSYDNNGLKLLQLRFYEISTDVN